MIKQHGTIRPAKHRGRDRVPSDVLLKLIGSNVARMLKLIGA